MTSPWIWIGFNLVILALLALDLGVFHRSSHRVGTREALIWTGVWVTLGLLFSVAVFYWRGSETALEYLTGYLIEKSLSVDNIFVFLLIFSHFRTPAAYQHKVLFWGIIGALLMRFAMILVGAALLERFHWLIYLFGAFLVAAGLRMALAPTHAVDLEANWLVRMLRKRMRITAGYEGDRFIVERDGVRWATPLLVVLLVVEGADLVFALDSIPAIFAITKDPFIVYSSNVFAILGLRSLFFALAGVMDRFHLLKKGLALVLGFVGVKMLISDFYKIPIVLSLGVIALILTAAVVLSLLFPKQAAPVAPGAGAHPETES